MLEYVYLFEFIVIYCLGGPFGLNLPLFTNLEILDFKSVPNSNYELSDHVTKQLTLSNFAKYILEAAFAPEAT